MWWVWEALALFQVVAFVVSVVICCCLYTVDGDISVVMGRRMPAREVRRRYMTEPNVAQRMFELCVYRSHEVLWPFTMVCSMSVSYVLLYMLDRLTLPAYMCTAPLLFVAFDMPRRFTHAHRLAAIDGEASLLIARYYELYHQNRKTSSPTSTPKKRL
jgi:hypothetical protein